MEAVSLISNDADDLELLHTFEEIEIVLLCFLEYMCEMTELQAY